MKYNKKDWLLELDAAFSAQIGIDHKTSKNNIRQIKFNPATWGIGYYVSQKHADWTTGQGVWCSQKKIADLFHFSNKTISDAFLLLEEIGFMRRDVTKERAGETKYYDLTMPYPSFLQTGGLLDGNKAVSSEHKGLCPEDIGGYVPGTQGVCSEDIQTTNITTNKELDNRTDNRESDNRWIGVKNPGKAGHSFLHSSFESILSIDEIAPPVQPLFSYKVRSKKENNEGGVCPVDIGSLVEKTYPASVNVEAVTKERVARNDVYKYLKENRYRGTSRDHERMAQAIILAMEKANAGADELAVYAEMSGVAAWVDLGW